MATTFAISAIVLIGGLAFAVDYTLMESQKNKLQSAADSAALAGALSLGQDRKNPKKHASDQAWIYAKDVNDKTLEGFESKIQIHPKTETVEVNLQVEVPRIFSQIYLDQDPTVRVRSVAKVVHINNTCLYVLDPTGPAALSTTGVSDINATNCSVQVHSTSANATRSRGPGRTKAREICIAGGYQGFGYSPTPETNCLIDPDPFANLIIPESTGCEHTNVLYDNTATLSPGTYCDGFEISFGGNITLNPGMYFIKDGTFEVNGASNIRGNGVVLVFEGSSTFDISGIAQIDISPPTSGPLAGFGIVQSRKADHGLTNKLRGTADIRIGGNVYLPNQTLDIAGTPSFSLDSNSSAALAVHRIDLKGHATINLKSGSDSQHEKSARLIK